MRATARVVARSDGRGGTRLAVLRGEPPLLPRRARPGMTHPAAHPTEHRQPEVYLVAGAAGPIGGDRLRLEIEVGPDASLCVRTVAASLALPGPSGAESRTTVLASVAAGGRLSWLPEPVIAAAGCRHVASSIVDVAEGGRLCWREELVCGRHGERPGAIVLRGTVRYAGRTIVRQDLAAGPDAPGWDGPAVLGGGRATGSVLLIDPAWTTTEPPRPAAPVPGGAALCLAGPGVAFTATATDLRGVRDRLRRLGAPTDHRDLR